MGMLSALVKTYYAEKKYDEAIKHMQIAIEKDPSDIENKLRLGNILMDTGRMEEGRQLLSTVDDSAVKDPGIFVNVGISGAEDLPDRAFFRHQRSAHRDTSLAL